MPRFPLIHIPNGIYSVVSKCNNDEFHFNCPEKFDLYLQHLLSCKRALGFRLYDLCCMSNHVHEMYVVPTKVTIADILQRVKGHFSRKFNAFYGRSGHFWRSKSFYRIVQDEYYVINNCIYYYHNPVKAGLVEHPEDWPYSGYKFHVLGDRSGLLGQLLDPIPSITGEDWQRIDPIRLEQVKLILQDPSARFVGDGSFQEIMRKQY